MEFNIYDGVCNCVVFKNRLLPYPCILPCIEIRLKKLITLFINLYGNHNHKESSKTVWNVSVGNPIALVISFDDYIFCMNRGNIPNHCSFVIKKTSKDQTSKALINIASPLAKLLIGWEFSHELNEEPQIINERQPTFRNKNVKQTLPISFKKHCLLKNDLQPVLRGLEE